MLPLKEESTLTVFNAYEYQRGLGQSNPVWQAVPQYFYPLDCKQIILYSLFVIGVILAVLGILIGFLFWATPDLSTYVLVWSIVLCVALVIAFYFLYVGGKDRRKQEKQLIQQMSRKQQQMMYKK